MKRHSLQSAAGFSLVEMLFYLSLLVSVSTVCVAVLLSFKDNIASYQASQRVTNSAVTTLERLLVDVRAAEAVNVGASTLTTNPGTLVLTDGATTTTYSVSDGAVSISVNGATVGPLTDATVVVDELRFFHYVNAETETVRVQLTLSATAGGMTVTERFGSSAVLLGSYD